MKKIYILFIALFTLLPSYAQEERYYDEVVVNDQFDFLKEKDRYQLNSMTKFYLNKKGLRANYFSEIESNDRCGVLYADVEKLSAFLSTKLQLVLKDCNGNEVFRSEAGKSKEKDFRVGYQDALRQTFSLVTDADLKIKKTTDIPNNKTEVVEISEPVNQDVAVKVAEPKIKIEESIVPEENNNIPQLPFTNYSLGDDNYLLQKTSGGYTFHRQDETSTSGLVEKGRITSKNGIWYFNDMDNKVWNVTFNKNQDIILQLNDMILYYNHID